MKISSEAKSFLNALGFMNGKDGKIKAQTMDEDTSLLYEIWYKIIVTECTKIYTKGEITKIKKHLITKAKEELERINSKRIIGYDSTLNIINQTETKRVEEIEDGIKYIGQLSEESIIEAIINSLYGSKELIELLKKHKDELEQTKLSKLSYKGQKCVEGTTINDEVAKRIYNHIKGQGLISISKQAELKIDTNAQYIALKEVEINARRIIISHIASIYREKINQIEKEIITDLEKISKRRYKDLLNIKYPNIVRILTQLEKEANKKIITKRKKGKIVDLINTIKGTIKHKNRLEKFLEQLEGFKITEEMKKTYSETQTSKEINEQKANIIKAQGIIINNMTDDIIELYIKNLKKELSDKIQLIDIYDEPPTEEELIKEFANYLGKSVKETISFLRNKDSIYACLYTHLFGTEILEKINFNNVETVLNEINPKLLKQNDRIPDHIKEICTKPKQQARQYKLKIPSKK